MTVRTETIGDATLYLGDCREILPMLEKFDAVVCDPPYGININKSNRLSVSRGFGADKWDEAPPDAELLELIRLRSDYQIIWGGNYFVLPPTRCFLIWDKINPGRDFADVEMAWTNLDKVARQYQFRPMNMDGGKVHPTQKPIQVMEWCLSALPKPVHTVLDPFMGSGTTGVACHSRGLKFTGIEREQQYFDVACRRIEAAQRQPRLFKDEPPQPKQLDMLA